jgi:oligopeptide transport system substrate-binding protein
MAVHAGSGPPTDVRCADQAFGTAHACSTASAHSAVRWFPVPRHGLSATILIALTLFAACARDETLAKTRRLPTDTLVMNLYAEPEVLDPALAHGHPDHVVTRQLFEGLFEAHPETLEPIPALAATHEVSSDGKVHVFTLRDDARWSDGRAITAHDVVGSLERVLRPSTASRAAAVLYVLENAQLYTEARIRRVMAENVRPRRPPFVVFGDGKATAPALGVFPHRATVELVDSNLRSAKNEEMVPLREEARHDAVVLSTMPRGATALVLAQKEVKGETWMQVRPDEGGRAAWAPASSLVPAFRGVDLRAVEGERERSHRRAILSEPRTDATVAFLVDDDEELEVLLDDGTFARVTHPSSGRTGFVESDVLDDVAGDRVWYVARVQGPFGVGEVGEGWVRARDLAMDASVLGVRALDDTTVELRLRQPVSYLVSLLTMSALRPVPLHVIERHGRAWTRPEHIVTSGPFHLIENRPHARIVLQRSETYRERSLVSLREVVLLSVVDEHTAISLYRAGQLDTMLAGKLPLELIPSLRDRRDYVLGPAFATYFVKLNTTRGPLVDERVRRALDLAIDKALMTEHLLRAGQRAATHLVPPGLPGYPVVDGEAHDPDAARALLASAGYENGNGFPRLRYLFNTSEHHRTVAEFLQRQWREVLNIDVEIENQEWKTYLQRMHTLDFDIARSGWIGEYLDPSTFLAQFASASPNNETGYASPAFDDLLARAAAIVDVDERSALLVEAERLLMREKPIIPLFFYVNNAMRVPELEGYDMNLLDHHPLRYVKIRPDAREERAP